MGVRIVGVSFNAPDKNLRWATEQKFPFEVWSDLDKTLALTYGAAGSRWTLVPSRITVVLDASGNVVLEYKDGVDVGTHPQDVLEDCGKVFGGEATTTPPSPTAGP